MTKYLGAGAFSSPANNKNYGDNYDRIFGKEPEEKPEDWFKEVADDARERIKGRPAYGRSDEINEVFAAMEYYPENELNAELEVAMYCLAACIYAMDRVVPSKQIYREHKDNYYAARDAGCYLVRKYNKIDE